MPAVIRAPLSLFSPQQPRWVFPIRPCSHPTSSCTPHWMEINPTSLPRPWGYACMALVTFPTLCLLPLPVLTRTGPHWPACPSWHSSTHTSPRAFALAAPSAWNTELLNNYKTLAPRFIYVSAQMLPPQRSPSDHFTLKGTSPFSDTVFLPSFLFLPSPEIILESHVHLPLVFLLH